MFSCTKPNGEAQGHVLAAGNTWNRVLGNCLPSDDSMLNQQNGHKLGAVSSQQHVVMNSLGIHLEQLGRAVSTCGTARDSKSYTALQRYLGLRLQTSYDSPSSEGYVVPGSSVSETSVLTSSAYANGNRIWLCVPPLAKWEDGYSMKPSDTTDAAYSNECPGPLVIQTLPKLSEKKDKRVSVSAGESENAKRVSGCTNWESSHLLNMSDGGSLPGTSSPGTGEGAHPLKNRKSMVSYLTQHQHQRERERKKPKSVARFTTASPISQASPVIHATSMGYVKKPPWYRRIETADTVIATVIMLNALQLGLSEDIPWDGWEACEMTFTVFFLFEMIAKLVVLGPSEYFLGKSRGWNWFDATIVAFSVLDFVASKVEGSGSMEAAGSGAPIIKMARLGRLARLIRLLRFKMFNELKMMVQGVFAGLRVLIWAIGLFFFFIYLVAMVLRKLIGDDDYPFVRPAFGKVPWAMFSTFRCLTDGCVANDGTPLTVHLYEHYGAMFAVPYMLVFLFVTIGLFNLIMAIFVDNVMETARVRRQDERSLDGVRLQKELQRCVQRVAYYVRQAKDVKVRPTQSKLRSRTLGWFSGRSCDADNSIDYEKLNDLVIDRDLFNKLIDDEEMLDMLDLMEISCMNRFDLFDVLDADMSGELELEEVINGLMNLRGPAEKSDTVASLLCVRVIQQVLKTFQLETKESFKALGSSMLSIEDKLGIPHSAYASSAKRSSRISTATYMDSTLSNSVPRNCS